MIGEALSHYKIVERLGGGGMGVVYRAVDTHLDRPVAIKVLRADALADPERKKRFVQEAKTASSLNHPNIITIHDIGSEGGVDYIAMEYVAGQTLDDLIGRKGLPLADGLKYAVEAADALAAAHAARIVHRDIKPSNIMITEQGRVKVLDFGLAKLTERSEDSPDAPTETFGREGTPVTEQGAILGTVAYMSPEQTQGLRVDARSDIFSFGAVLYEMVTGRRAFQGETKMSILAAILREDPAPVSEVAPAVPAELERVIARCLRKDPQRRFQTMADLKVALEELKEESATQRPISRVPMPTRRPSVALWALVTLVVMVGAGATAWWWHRNNAKQAVRPAAELTRLTFDAGLNQDPALSPDGKLLAYASDRGGEGNLDIWVRQLGGGGIMRLTRDAADESQPAFSPDGSHIAFRSERAGGGIYLIPTLGGEEPKLIAPGGRRPRFSPDGSRIAFTGAPPTYKVSAGGNRVHIVSATSGAPQQVAPDFWSSGWPVWLADGKHLLFVGKRDVTAPPEQSYDWWVAPVDGGLAVKTGAYELFRRAGLGELAPWLDLSPQASWENQVIFTARSGDTTNLWRVAISQETWKVSGPPERLTFGTGLETDASVVAGSGESLRLAFSSQESRVYIASLPIDAQHGKPAGQIQQLTHEIAFVHRPALSADGKKMVYLGQRSGKDDVWLLDLETGKTTAVTATPANEDCPMLSPDGSWVAYVTVENGIRVGYVTPAPGQEPAAPIRVCQECTLYDWTADGARILYTSGQPLRASVFDLRSGQSAELLRHPEWDLNRVHLSEDNRWVAFRASVAANRKRLFIAPFLPGNPPAPSEWIFLLEGSGDDRPAAAWSPDGTLVYLLLQRDGDRCLWAQRLEAATKRPISAPFVVQHFHPAGGRGLIATGFGRSMAAGRFVFNQGQQTGSLWMTQVEAR